MSTEQIFAQITNLNMDFGWCISEEELCEAIWITFKSAYASDVQDDIDAGYYHCQCAAKQMWDARFERAAEARDLPIDVTVREETDEDVPFVMAKTVGQVLETHLGIPRPLAYVSPLTLQLEANLAASREDDARCARLLKRLDGLNRRDAMTLLALLRERIDSLPREQL